MTDPIVESVIRRLAERSEEGMQTYGVGLDRTDLTFIQWAEHARDEALDTALYLERMILEVRGD